MESDQLARVDPSSKSANTFEELKLIQNTLLKKQMKLNAGSSAITVERLSAMEFMDGIHFPQKPQCLQCDTQEEKLLN